MEYCKRDLYQLALKFREITKTAGVLLIINDHTDIALAVDADGVHLGQDDLPLSAARKLATELLIGVSTHSLEEALVAERDGADYVTGLPKAMLCPPPTKTKKGVEYFLGPDAIPAISRKIKIPFTVMGGIKESNIDQVVARGAHRMAVVTAITQAPDIAEAVKSLKNKLRGQFL